MPKDEFIIKDIMEVYDNLLKLKKCGIAVEVEDFSSEEYMAYNLAYRNNNLVLTDTIIINDDYGEFDKENLLKEIKRFVVRTGLLKKPVLE